MNSGSYEYHSALTRDTTPLYAQAVIISTVIGDNFPNQP